jgi:uroporphyrin-III C-methyltransferase/precorrin-2 dehydrogenase/sirohydrochlorin ferrochelatase
MYPVSLIVTDRQCLVVGGGGVALRKIQGLVEDGARVTVIAPEVVDPIAAMADHREIVLERRRYDGDAVGEWALVFAATDDRETNAQVYRDCESHGVWCNVADDPDYCSFHLAARIRREPLQIAIGSAGEAPFAVSRLRRLLERRIGEEWSEWMAAAARFRLAVRALDVDASEANRLFDRFFSSTVDADTLRARVPTEAEEREWLEVSIDHRSSTAVPPPAGPAACRETRGATGFVSLVGAGPGCPGLLTVRGQQRLARAQAVVFDRLAAPALPGDLAPSVELHPVGKTAGVHPMPQEEINALLVRLAREGKRVVRLKGGDPYVFGRGGEEAEVLAAEGVPFEVVPGVTSGVAALAWAGIPATHRREAVRVTLLTAHEAIKSEGPQVRWDLLAQDPHDTLVGYMGVSALPQVVEKLLASGMDPATPAAMVERGTTAAQRRVVSTLADLQRDIERAGLEPPALFVIGPTVAHADRLDWYSALPLAGFRILTTASRSALAGILEERGADVVVMPLPVTPASRVVAAALPIDGALVCDRSDVDWLDDLRDGSGLGGDAITWCVGREAADRAREREWSNVIEIEPGLECDELVSRIAGSAGSRRRGLVG